ncbi:EpsG family protein [Streptococcus oricebi]|uniref:EpsG family protein n=1 Tax=Streptococcus oricebi TaxID=1547447 RepID=A0ABS5B5I3_9STRE|nr:EpsG family protein [Streptococcus oricebi]MBP2623961.1 hypothetical protein [Streptococcus oricebi]
MIPLIIFSSLICLYYFLFARIHNDRLLVYPINLGILNTLFLSASAVILMTANRIGYDAVSFTRFFYFSRDHHANLFDYTYEILSNIIIAVTKFFPLMTYPVFHALVLVLTGLIFIRPLLKTYAVSLASVLSLYILSGVYASDGMQFKNFISVSILLYACYQLFKGGKSKLLAYYAWLLLAVLFHFSFAIYAFLPLILWKRLQKVSNLFPIIGSLLYLSLMLGIDGFKALIVLFAQVPFLAKLSIYASQTAGIRSIVPVGIYCLLLLLLEYYRRSNHFLTEDKQSLLVSTIYIWRLLGILLPALYFANAPYRLFRNVYLIVFLVATNIVLASPIHTLTRIKNALFLLVVIFLIYMYPILLGQNIDIYSPVLDNGVFFWLE